MSGGGETAQGCSGCGLLAPGGAAGCEAIFHEMVARDFSDALRFRVHRMMVDTYSLQHPDRYCASARSFAAHLTGLCAILESGASRAVGDELLRRWLDGNVRLQRPVTPRFRGELTIAHVREALEPDAYATPGAVGGLDMEGLLRPPTAGSALDSGSARRAEAARGASERLSPGRSRNMVFHGETDSSRKEAKA